MILNRTDLVESPVRFDEFSHTYELDGRQLSGITGLIHSQLGLGVYPDADEYTECYLIPKAGSRGTAVHHAIQTFDELGIEDCTQQVETVYCKGYDNEHVKTETWDVSAELSKYKAHLYYSGFRAVANEYTVSDGVRYASQIDNVWQHLETKEIWLVDTKTNNVDLYPVCGYFQPRFFRNGVEALKEYLSWQLSIYAYLFEKQNKGLKVGGLACNWLRPDRGAFWIIDRKPDEQVELLLMTETLQGDNGWIYYHPDFDALASFVPVKKKDENLPILPPNVINYMTELNAKVKEYSAKFEEAKTALRKAMETANIDKCDLGLFKATLSANSSAKTFDTARFKKENPELYAKYIIEKEKKGSLIIKFRENDKD